jgi:hypothetical protein
VWKREFRPAFIYYKFEGETVVKMLPKAMAKNTSLKGFRYIAETQSWDL